MKIRVLRTYRWVDKDPIIDALRTCFADQGLNKNQVSQLSGVAGTTLHNWFDGDTRRPSNSTATAVSAALGYVRADRLRADGTVEVRYIHVRDYDYRDELKRAADFWLKQNTGGRRKRKRKARNGAS